MEPWHKQHCSSYDTSYTTLHQVDKKVLQLLEQRCKDKFFSHKQRGLARTDVAAHFKSLALTACSIAVKKTILSRHNECIDASSVHRLIEDNLDEARDAWKEEAKTQLQQFLDKQFSLLLWDVIGERPPTAIAPPPRLELTHQTTMLSTRRLDGPGNNPGR